MNKLKAFFIFGMVLIFTLSKNLEAHTDVIINYRIFFKFNNLKVTDIGENWAFDKITSEELIKKYKLEKKTTLNKKESTSIGQKIMEDLWEVRYFTYISVNHQDIGRIKASGFKAQINEGILSVAFNNHLPKVVDVTKENLKIEVKDVDSLIKTKLVEKQPVLLIGTSKEDCKINIKEKRQRVNKFIEEDPFMDLLYQEKEISVKCKRIE